MGSGILGMKMYRLPRNSSSFILNQIRRYLHSGKNANIQVKTTEIQDHRNRNEVTNSIPDITDESDATDMDYSTGSRDVVIESSLYVNSLMQREPKKKIVPPGNIRAALSVKALMVAGAHLGHCPENWNRNMLPFIYGIRNRIHIINLEHTLTELRRACAFLKHLRSLGGRILFIGKRPQIHTIVYDAARLSSSYYAFTWNGSIMHHNPTSLHSLSYKNSYLNLASLIRNTSPETTVTINCYDREKLMHSPVKNDETSKNKVKIVNFQLCKKLDPINMHYPDAIVVLDYMNCLDVISDSNKASVPVVAICDTDCDPNAVQYVIPANDDSLSSVSLISGILSLSIKEGAVLYNSYDIRKKSYYNPSLMVVT